jgi:hypothetical protein
LAAYTKSYVVSRLASQCLWIWWRKPNQEIILHWVGNRFRKNEFLDPSSFILKSCINSRKVAVLLVTPDFIASDFIHEHELGPLLKEAEQGGVQILWVPLYASAYKETALKNYQAVLSPDKPLAGMTPAKRAEAWVRICEEIQKAVSEAKTAKAISDIESRQNQQAQEIKLLRFFIANFIGQFALNHLKGLEMRRPYPFDSVPWTFEAELVDLRSRGLINHFPNKGIVAMKKEGRGELNDHFYITDLGRQYLRLRQEVAETEGNERGFERE